MFYDYEIDIMGFGEGHLTSNGIWVEGKEEIISSVAADIQPYTNELAYRQYGYEGDVSYKIYCENDIGLKLDASVLIDTKPYKIVVCKNWEDYTILVVVDKDGY